MNNGSSGKSNTLTLVSTIMDMQGRTFAEKAANYEKVLDARLSRAGQGSDEWHKLLRTKGLVQGLIRFDGKDLMARNRFRFMSPNLLLLPEGTSL
jgi:hypothetical protein